MSEKMAEILFKVIGSRLEDITMAYDASEVERHVDAISFAMEQLKTLVADLIHGGVSP